MSKLFGNISTRPLVLAVDDSVENLQVLSAILKDDYQVKVAKSGQKALEIAQNSPHPDLILLDVMMPDMNGFKVLAFYTLKRLSLTISEIILGLNAILFVIAGFFFGVELALYSMLTYFAASKTIGYVIGGIEEYTVAANLSSVSESIKEASGGVLKKIAKHG